MHLHLNPLGGLAGDMFCAALLDAHPELLTRVREAVAAIDMPRPVRIELEPAEDPLGGQRFRVRPLGDAPSNRHHTPYREIRALLEDAALESGTRDRALAIFALLARAEAQVHGTTPDEVAFHEVGSWDSIADIAAATLLDALHVTGASCAPLPIGGGRAHSAHGVLPVPAPATLLLLEGLAVRDDGIEGERVTPTGAAILRSLEPLPVAPAGVRLRDSGRGFGTRRLPDIPNCLQILCLEPTEAQGGLTRDRVAELRFEVDDQTPEDLALGLDRLREIRGVLSVTTRQAIGKKGRPTMAIEVLAVPDRLQAVAEACFQETATIGLRHQEIDRLILVRDQRVVEAAGRRVGVKVVRRPGGATAKVESDDLSEMAGYRQRERLRRDAGREALGKGDESEKDRSNG